MIVIEVVFQAAADALAEFTALMGRTMSGSQQENGCILYRFTADLKVSGQFFLTEIWENESDLKTHFAGKVFKDFFAQLPGKGGVVRSSAWEGPLVPYVPPNPAL